MLLRECLNKCFHSIVGQNGRIKDELGVLDLVAVDVEAVWHERVPVVEVVELQRDSVLVLEPGIEKKFWVKLQVQQIPTQVLDIVFNHNPDGLA